MSGVWIRTRGELRTQRRPRSHSCWGHLFAAPLWPMHNANLRTLLRTCDAVDACVVEPTVPGIDEALARGNTLRGRSCVHRVRQPVTWLERQRAGGARIVGVELADGAVRLGDLPAARSRTIVVLGHERTGIPHAALSTLDQVVE